MLKFFENYLFLEIVYKYSIQNTSRRMAEVFYWINKSQSNSIFYCSTQCSVDSLDSCAENNCDEIWHISMNEKWLFLGKLCLKSEKKKNMTLLYI